MTLEELYREAFSSFRENISDDLVSKLALYHSELLRWNRRVSLTALSRDEEVAAKLFFDSAAGLPFLREDDVLLDLGTGPGFPGLVLALFRPEIPVLLAEVRTKKVAFLKRMRHVLGLERVIIVDRRVEGVQDLPEVPTALTSKATGPPDEILSLGRKLLRPDGRVILYSGKTPGKAEGFRLVTRSQYDLPFGFGRRVLQVFAREG